MTFPPQSGVCSINASRLFGFRWKLVAACAREQIEGRALRNFAQSPISEAEAL